jgi:hypothetical protein
MTPSLHEWIDHVFIRRDSDSEWTGPLDQIPALIAATFDHAGELLMEFSDEQLDDGFWYLLDGASPEFMPTLVDDTIPRALRVQTLRSFVPLFEEVMAVRCTPVLSHLDEACASGLNSSCYMWWDLLRFPLWRQSTLPNGEILETLWRLLAIPHDACRESALHGIGHLRRDCPQYDRQLSAMVDEFLAGPSSLRPESIAYAERVRRGAVL